MAETDPARPLEPWPGYADLNPDQRLELFNKKTEAARLNNDQGYAIALASAVGNFELLRQAAPQLTADEPTRDAAHDLHEDAGSWKPD
jgi:hypothetical protein